MARRNAKPRLFATDSLSNLAASLNGGQGQGGERRLLPQLPAARPDRGDVSRRLAGPQDRRHRALRQHPRMARMAGRPRRRGRHRADRAAARAAQGCAAGHDARPPLWRWRHRHRHGGGGSRPRLAAPLDPEAVGPGGHPLPACGEPLAARVTTAVSRDPLDPYYGEPAAYALAAPLRGELLLHPSRVVRFLGNPVPDPAAGGGRSVVGQRAADALRRHARGGADGGGGDQPDARGEGGHRDGAGPVRAPEQRGDDGAALGAVLLCRGDEVDQQPAAAGRRGDLGAAADRFFRPAGDGAHLPADGGGGGGHPGDAAARAVPGRECRRRGTATPAITTT